MGTLPRTENLPTITVETSEVSTTWHGKGSACMVRMHIRRRYGIDGSEGMVASSPEWPARASRRPFSWALR